LSNPIFVPIKKRHFKSTGLPVSLAFASLPLRQLPDNMPHEDRLLAMQREATREVIRGYGEGLTAAIQKSSSFRLALIALECGILD
jgi:hypothetical protein